MSNKAIIQAIKIGFRYSGVKGIYVLDHVAFKDSFDEAGICDWNNSTGKKKLQEWAEKNLTKEILEQFDVDIPVVEEVFSQKTLNLYDSTKKLTSCQFPIFQNSDNRIMEFYGKPMWWWTRSNYGIASGRICFVHVDGGLYTTHKNYYSGFVPILRKKK